MVKFQNHYNRDKHPVKGEVNNLESMTIPDQSFTIEEIYRRFAQGRPVNVEKVPIYDGDRLLPEFHRLDLAEREQLLQDVAGRVKMLQRDYQTLKTQYDAKQAQKKQQSNSDTAQAKKPETDATQNNSSTAN